MKANAEQANVLTLSTSDDFYQPLPAYVSYFLDDSLALSVDDVLQRQEMFKPVDKQRIGFGVTSSRIWLIARVANPVSQSQIWWLDFNQPAFKEMDAYLLRRDAPRQKLISQRAEHTFKLREIKDRLLISEVELGALEQATILVSYRAQSSSFLPLAIATSSAVKTYRDSENLINWATNGALIAIIVFALMLTAVIGWRLSTSFALYIAAGTWFIFHSDGYTFEYLWPNIGGLYEPLHLSFMLLMPIFGLQFARTLFNFKSHNLGFDRIILAYILVASLVVLSTKSLASDQRLWLIAYYVVPLGSALQLASGALAARQRLLGWLPYLIGTVLVISPFFYAVASHLKPGLFNASTAINFTHFSLLGECLAFAAAITIRLLGVRQERDEAVTAELSATQDRLQLSSDLQKTQEDYIRARKLSDMRRSQLDTVSHDLQQPLASLRLALAGLENDDEGAVKNMHSAFDYMESLAVEHLQRTHGVDDSIDPVINQKIESEVFSIKVVLDNVYKMFKDEATEKGLDFRYRPISVSVQSEPITLMRAVNNLVANAIKHTESGGLLLCARRRKKSILIQVWDTGDGLSQDELHRIMRRYEKGANSKGHGLGLSIVQSISNKLNLGFKLSSQVGRGSVASLIIDQSD